MHSIKTEENENKFLTHLAETGAVKKSAQFAEIGLSTVYEWYDSDSAFAAKWEAAIKHSRRVFANKLEVKAQEYALGHKDPILYKGMDTGLKRTKYNAGLIQFMLKNLIPETYKEADLSLNNTGDPMVMARTLYNNLRASGEDHQSASTILLKLGVAGQHIPPGEEDKEETDI